MTFEVFFNASLSYVSGKGYQIVDLNLDDDALSDTREGGFNNKISVKFGSTGKEHNIFLVSKKLLVNFAANYGLHITSSKDASNNFR